jgi:hypothetical protein
VSDPFFFLFLGLKIHKVVADQRVPKEMNNLQKLQFTYLLFKKSKPNLRRSFLSPFDFSFKKMAPSSNG